MKRTRIEKIERALPYEIERLIYGGKIYDSSSSPEARVYFIDKDEGYYLKLAEAGALEKEAKMNAYFNERGIGPEVLFYLTGDEDIMLTRSVLGEDCTHAMYLDEPKRLTDTIALSLRELHEMDYTGCPIQDRTADYIRGAMLNYHTGNYDTSHFPDSFGYASAEEAYAALMEGKEALRSRVLLHGDYCLPNIMLDGWRLSGFIDLGCGGVGDRHIDLFWGAWTLWFNLKTDKYRERFLDAYGRDVIDEDIMRVVAAAEVFG